MHVHGHVLSQQVSSLREGVAPRGIYTPDIDKKAGTMGPKPRNSLYYCGHCDKQLSKTVFYRHKRLYYGRRSKTWSYESDIYSFGRILSQINSQKLRLPILTRMGEECLSSEYKRRPTAKDLKVLVFHLF